MLTSEQQAALDEVREAAAEIGAGARPARALALARKIERAVQVLKSLQASSQGSASIAVKVKRAPNASAGDSANGAAP
jgi:hypothetical protein